GASAGRGRQHGLQRLERSRFPHGNVIIGSSPNSRNERFVPAVLFYNSRKRVVGQFETSGARVVPTRSISSQFSRCGLRTIRAPVKLSHYQKAKWLSKLAGLGDS
ncbi:MAG TPA: hypothetical protein VFC17_05950, partial [Candidatus Limnocylindrales bacterium]|nr:hypothetical protein [Candidatus Limnocylindrales bacterium]